MPDPKTITAEGLEHLRAFILRCHVTRELIEGPAVCQKCQSLNGGGECARCITRFALVTSLSALPDAAHTIRTLSRQRDTARSSCRTLAEMLDAALEDVTDLRAKLKQAEDEAWVRAHVETSRDVLSKPDGMKIYVFAGGHRYGDFPPNDFAAARAWMQGLGVE